MFGWVLNMPLVSLRNCERWSLIFKRLIFGSHNASDCKVSTEFDINSVLGEIVRQICILKKETISRRKILGRWCIQTGTLTFVSEKI